MSSCVKAPSVVTDSTNPEPRAINLYGDRHIEWSWLAGHLPPLAVKGGAVVEDPGFAGVGRDTILTGNTSGGGELLDFGCGDSWVSLVGVHRGYRVTTLDLEVHDRPYVEPHLRHITGDILEVDLPEAHFDVVFNCSAIEHVGITGRYGVSDPREDGDLLAMSRLRRAMKRNGVMIMTIPVGRDAVFLPMCRVYGEDRLPRLLDGFEVAEEAYWVKDQEDDSNRWIRSTREVALNYECEAGDPDWRRNIYGLGCFVLEQ